MNAVSKCPLCGSKKTNKKVYSYVKCLSCGTFYQFPMPPSAWLNRAVQKYGKEVHGGEVDDAQKETFQRRLKALGKYIKPGSKILDVGCGGGLFVQVAKEAGYKVEGMDKAIACVRFVRTLGIPAYTSLSKIPNNYYDAITIFDVIEHVTNPSAFLVELHKKLKRNGILMLTTPNIGGLVGKIRPSVLTQPEELYSEHTILFDKSSLSYVLKKTSFKQLDGITDTLMAWSYNSNVLQRKIVNKAVYLLLLPFQKYLFQFGLGDNLQVIAKKLDKK